MTYDFDRLLRSGRKVVMGHNALLIEWPDQAIQELHPDIHALAFQLKQVYGQHLIDIIPSLNSLCLLCRYRHDVNYIVDSLPQLQCHEINPLPPSCQYHISVKYYPESHEDIKAIMLYTGLSYEEVLLAHQSTNYQVIALGFLPGFAYMGYTVERFRVPRKSNPNLRVPAGAVAIAEDFTAIYPCSSPGGWYLIGETNFIPFDKQSGAVLKAGDQIKFLSNEAQ